MSMNPLLMAVPPLPFSAVSPEHVEPAIETLLSEARLSVSRLVCATPNFEALKAYDRLTSRLDVAMAIVDHLEGVLGTPELRAALAAVLPKVSAFQSSLLQDERLLELLRSIEQHESLPAPWSRFLKRAQAELIRHGASLDGAAKARLEAIEVELSTLCNRFGQNVVDATDSFSLVVPDQASVAGLPESAREAARARAAEVGQAGFRFTLQAPSYLPVLTHLDDAQIRETLYRAHSTRATQGETDNRTLVGQILTLRAEQAKLLGFRDTADYLLEPRMAQRGDTAVAFVDDLARRTRPYAEAEAKALLAWRRVLEGEDAPPLEAWDIAYYAEKERRARFDFDAEALRPYFPVAQVLQGLFSLAQRLFGVEVRPLQGESVWHPSVEVYALNDVDGTRLGTFYVDLFPRAGKRGGAWMRPFFTGDPRGVGTPHVAVMCANVTPPLNGQPALLTHDEVETLFHEFGHLLHHLLTEVEILSLAGTNVAWDFVELPSQILENWCWTREGLDLFARHYQTGELVPAALFERLVRARTFRSGSAQMRQLGFATVDLALHRDVPLEPIAVARELFQRFTPAPLPEDFAMIASFTHLFADPVGYAAGYYSYKWAEALDADAFTRFEAEGLFSSEVGQAFRRHILSAGNRDEPAALFQAFMGRGPDAEALLRRAGLG